MALDHYISQVHLKRFYSPDLDGLMHAIRKSDLKQFTPRSKSVCRIDEGSTNYFLEEPRVIEEFLKDIENKYNSSVSKFETGTPDQSSIYIIAGFVGYVMSCSPTAMRIASKPILGALEITAKFMEEDGSIPPPPTELGGDSISELISSGKLIFKVDEKFPQAIGIANIYKAVSMYGNFQWDILINKNNDCPFFTSDYPIAIEPTSDLRIINRIVPLTPNIAVRFFPNIHLDPNRIDFDFRKFSYRRREIARQEAIEINRLLVRSAEDLVFFRDDRPWVASFIEKNRHYRLDTQNTEFPQPGGSLLLSQQKITPHLQPSRSN